MGAIVRVIRDDGGGEFSGNKAKRWYDDLGINHQASLTELPRETCVPLRR